MIISQILNFYPCYMENTHFLYKCISDIVIALLPTHTWAHVQGQIGPPVGSPQQSLELWRTPEDPILHCCSDGWWDPQPRPREPLAAHLQSERAKWNTWSRLNSHHYHWKSPGAAEAKKECRANKNVSIMTALCLFCQSDVKLSS